MKEREQERRGWLVDLARYAALAMLGGGTAGLVARTAGAPPGQQCPRPGPCRECAALNDCRLPEAERVRVLVGHVNERHVGNRS